MRTTLGTFVFFILFLLALIQSYWFQNWAIQKVTSYLSSELNTTVKIDHIGIDILSNLTLDGLYIQDLRQDTLLYAEKLRVDYDLMWKTLSGDGLTINGLMLENARINLYRGIYDQNNNAQFLIDYFVGTKPKDPNKTKKPFDLRVQYVSFKKIDFRQKDIVAGNEIYAFLDEGAIGIDQMNLLDNCIQIRSIEFIQPSVIIKQKEKHPLPERDTTPELKLVSNKSATAKAPLHITLDRFRLSGGHIVFDNYRASAAHKTPANLIDFNHLDLSSLNFDIDDLDMLDEELNATLTGISVKENSGFILDKLAATHFRFSPRSIELNDFVLKTPFTELRDTLQFRFKTLSDFNDFNNKVRINAVLYDSHLALKDLMPFDRKIAENDFFIKNQTEQFKIKGKITGKVNRLSADSLQIDTKGLSLQGNLNLNDVTDPNNVFISFKINKLASDINTVKLFSGLKELPSGVEKLNHFNFNGFFYGFPYDFSAQGHLSTALGLADMDIVYKPDERIGKSVYNGGVSLSNFDLKTFTGNDDFGKVTLETHVSNGTGFTASSAEADLSAKIKSFAYKGYTYENLIYKGKLDSKLIDGAFSIQDKNIDFKFDGTIDLRDSLPRYDFQAQINHIYLQPLNLSKERIDVAGDVEISLIGNKPDNIVGVTRIKHAKAFFKGQPLELDSLLINAAFDESRTRKITFNSNILKGFISGDFNFARLPKSLQNYMVYYHPQIAKRLNISPDPLLVGNDKIDFELDIDNTQNFTRLIHKDLDTIRGVHIDGSFDNVNQSLRLSSLFQSINFQNIKLTDFGYNVNLEQGKGDVDVQLYHTNIQDKYHINLITILGKLQGDDLLFDINGNRVSGELDSLNLNGMFSVQPDYFQVGFLQSKFTLLGERWFVNKDNYLRFDKGFIDTKNFNIQSGKRSISLTSIEKYGLNLNIKGFDFSIIDKLLKDDRFAFKGEFEVDARVENIFKLNDISAVINADTLNWNNRDWGKFRLDAHLQNLKSPLRTALFITKNDEQISLEGFYVLPGNTYTTKKKVYGGNYVHTTLTTSNVPMVWISYLIGSGVSDMKGKVDAQMLVDGPLNDIQLDGKVRVQDAAFKIDYLNTTYFIKDDTARITTTLIDATGAKIYDETGNFATIEGGLTHKLFDKMRLKCVIDSKDKNVLVMNTTKAQNETYYGKAIGQVRVRFSGSFSRTFIDVERAVTAKGTQLNIPVSNAQEAKAVTFVKFREKNVVNDGNGKKQKVKTSGLGFSMTLNMTEDADCRIIFNEQTGDVIQGRGAGLLNINVPIEGDFSMKGDFTFTEGKYLFTIRQQFISVDKPFVLRPGGTVRWNGDPFDAKIDIWADYVSPSISPYELLAPYLTTDLEKQNARTPTQVELAMNMTGNLLKPDIAFDIRLPQLIGQMKNYADSRINTIKQDMAEMNRQVFAVIVLGGFLPSDQQTVGIGGVTSAINNTLSGIISSQFTNYINSWLRDVIHNNGIVSGVDLNINTNTGVDYADPTQGYNSFQFRPRVNLFDNKLSIDAGFVTSELNNTTLISSDLAVEWYVTKDRQLRFRVYNRNVQDIQGQRNRTGLGLNWRKDFDKWSDLFKKKKKPNN